MTTTRSHIAKHAEESQQIADDHSHLQSEHGRVRSALARYAPHPQPLAGPDNRYA